LDISSIKCEETPPIIPNDLFYINKKQKLLCAANKIARDAFAYMLEHKETEIDILKAISKSKLESFNEYSTYFPDIDRNETMLSFIRRRCSDVSYPAESKPANNVIYSVFVLSPKGSDQITTNLKLHQWILALGSNTLSELTDAIICPLCELSKAVSHERESPRKIQIDDDFIYDISNGLDVEIGNTVTKMNEPCVYVSSSGCTHTILFTAAIAVCVRGESVFPMTIGGRGATPPFCCMCTVNPGTVAVRESSENPVEFVCLNCSSNIPKEHVIKDLTTSFFHAEK
jgi:hypothetical protein